MDNSIATARPDVVALETSPRPTAPPVRIPFAEVLSGSAIALVQGAQAAVRALPGAPVVAAAVRGGGLAASTGQPSMVTPEGPTAGTGATMAPLAGIGGALSGVGGAGGVSGTGAGGDGGVESTLAQSQQMNLYYLQIQQQVNDQNRTFTLLSNVIEVEHSTAKSAIGNIH